MYIYPYKLTRQPNIEKGSLQKQEQHVAPFESVYVGRVAYYCGGSSHSVFFFCDIPVIGIQSGTHGQSTKASMYGIVAE